MIKTISPNITNLVFEGGGIHAIAFGGFLDQAVTNKLLDLSKISKVAGVSAGSITALMIALNYSCPELLSVIDSTNFALFEDNKLSIFSSVLRLFTEDALYSSEYLYKYISNLIVTKTNNKNYTFKDLHDNGYKDLYVLATRLTKGANGYNSDSVTFSYETTPNARLVDAVRASCGIPFVFRPMRLLDTDKSYSISSKGNVFVDGGVLNIYPISIFDINNVSNSQTLGLAFCNKPSLQSPLPINSLITQIASDFDYSCAVLSAVINNQQKIIFDKTDNAERTIFLDVLNISSIDFGITEENKQNLIQSGRNAANRLQSSQ